MKLTAFCNVPTGAVFWWGGYSPDRSNWGRKRSSRTADYRPLLNGKLSDHMDWAYWSANESVWYEPAAS